VIVGTKPTCNLTQICIHYSPQARCLAARRAEASAVAASVAPEASLKCGRRHSAAGACGRGATAGARADPRGAGRLQFRRGRQPVDCVRAEAVAVAQPTHRLTHSGESQALEEEPTPAPRRRPPQVVPARLQREPSGPSQSLLCTQLDDESADALADEM
jgi:hypothetical protein